MADVWVQLAGHDFGSLLSQHAMSLRQHNVRTKFAVPAALSQPAQACPFTVSRTVGS